MTLVRGLAWLVRLDGRHCLGDLVLRTLLELAGRTDQLPLVDVRVDREESLTTLEPVEGEAERTRADLIVRSSTCTLVVEAKVHAGEQPGQLARLRRTWGGERNVHFLFITRSGIRQQSAGEAGDWPHTTWADLADLIAFRLPPTSAPEVLSLLHGFRRI